MSVETTLGRTYFDVLSVVKTTIINNLIEARGQGRFSAEEADFQTILNFIDLSISQAGPNGLTPLVSAVESYIKTTPTTKAKKSRHKYTTK